MSFWDVVELGAISEYPQFNTKQYLHIYHHSIPTLSSATKLHKTLPSPPNEIPTLLQAQCTEHESFIVCQSLHSPPNLYTHKWVLLIIWKRPKRRLPSAFHYDQGRLYHLLSLLWEQSGLTIGWLYLICALVWCLLGVTSNRHVCWTWALSVSHHSWMESLWICLYS